MLQFFKKVFSSLPLLLRFVSSVIFISIGSSILLSPQLTIGLEAAQRTLFGGLILVYGSYRFLTFILEYRRLDEENEG